MLRNWNLKHEDEEDNLIVRVGINVLRDEDKIVIIVEGIRGVDVAFWRDGEEREILKNDRNRDGSGRAVERRAKGTHVQHVNGENESGVLETDRRRSQGEINVTKSICCTVDEEIVFTSDLRCISQRLRDESERIVRRREETNTDRSCC